MDGRDGNSGGSQSDEPAHPFYAGSCKVLARMYLLEWQQVYRSRGEMELLTDDQLAKRVGKGHIEDFSELMRHHQAVVFRLAYRILGRREEAEDAVQETFLRAYQNLNSYRGDGKFRAWVRRIAVNVCLRKFSREVPHDDLDSLPDTACPSDNPVEAETLANARQADIRRAVDGLPIAYRTVVILRYMEDLSYAEIAELAQEPVTTIRVGLHRAKKMLNERLTVILDEV